MFDSNSAGETVLPHSEDSAFQTSPKARGGAKRKSKKTPASSKQRGRPKKSQPADASPPTDTTEPLIAKEDEQEAKTVTVKRNPAAFAMVPRNQPQGGRADFECAPDRFVQLLFSKFNEYSAAAVTPHCFTVTNAAEQLLVQMVREAGDPADPNERAMVESQTTLHMTALSILADATHSNCVQTTCTLTELAAKVMGESRRTALAIAKYRRAPIRPKLTTIAQQNVAQRQQVAFDTAATGGNAEPNAAQAPPQSDAATAPPTSSPALELKDRMRGLVDP